MRNKLESHLENEETPDATKNLGQNGDVTSGSFQGLGKDVPILHCEILCDDSMVWKLGVDPE